MSLDTFVRGYLAAALWASSDDGGGPLDGEYDVSDFTAKSIKTASKECDAFMRANAEDLSQAGNDDQNGHDFWLTRNRHGVGFWDRGYDKAVGDRLTKASQACGERNVFTGKKHKLHIEPG